MHKENRQLIVYLSKSLKVEEERLQEIRQQLISCGFLVQEFRKGSTYNPNIRNTADFMLVVPYLPTLESEPRKWWTNVGRGQFGEVKEACNEDQPTFIYMGYEDEEILMTKCEEDYDSHFQDSSGDWKSNYGTIVSYVVGNSPVPLYDFITGYMEDSKSIRHNVQRYKEYPTSSKNSKLLLL